MGGESDRGRELLSEARSRGLLFGMCSGRLWVHLSGEHTELAHLATTLLVHEDAVLTALVDEGAVPPDAAPGGDHDQPYRPGMPLPFSRDEMASLERLRALHANRPPDDRRPAGG